MKRNIIHMSKKVEKGKKINETNFLYNIIYNQD